MTDTLQGAWMREYERRRSDLENAAYDVGDARNGEEEERAEAVAAMARKALDAHVRTLVEERDADARRLARRLANATPPSLDYPNGYTRLAERFHAILTDAAAVAGTQTPTEGGSDG